VRGDGLGLAQEVLQHVIQTLLHGAVAQTAADIACLQILNCDVIFVERIQIREDHVCLRRGLGRRPLYGLDQ